MARFRTEMVGAKHLKAACPLSCTAGLHVSGAAVSEVLFDGSDVGGSPSEVFLIVDTSTNAAVYAPPLARATVCCVTCFGRKSLGSSDHFT